MKKINVLGTEYKINFSNQKEDENLKDCDGYCDKSTKEIVVIDESENQNLGNFKAYQDKVLRHEIVHAFMFESGLSENWKHADLFGHDETVVDWFAIQFPKILKVYKELEITGVEGVENNEE